MRYDPKPWLEAVARSPLAVEDRALASILAVHFDERGEARPSQAELMRALSWTRDQLRVALDQLQDHGLVRRTLRPFSVEVPVALLVDVEAPVYLPAAVATRDVMDVEQVAEYLGLAVSTVYKKVEYREIPYAKVGSLLRFPKWLIDQWLTRTAVRPRDSILRQFEELQRRYHFQAFLDAQGLDIDRLTDDQLLDEVRGALDELKEKD